MTELTIDQALQQGIEAHKAGQVQEADRLYTAILKAQPKHPEANHNMGVLAVGVGHREEEFVGEDYSVLADHGTVGERRFSGESDILSGDAMRGHIFLRRGYLPARDGPEESEHVGEGVLRRYQEEE